MFLLMLVKIKMLFDLSALCATVLAYSIHNFFFFFFRESEYLHPSECPTQTLNFIVTIEVVRKLAGGSWFPGLCRVLSIAWRTRILELHMLIISWY